MVDRNDDRFSSPAALQLAQALAARSSEKPKSVAPGYVLGTDADGNTVLIPTDVQPSGRGGIFDNAAREWENYGPRASDFTDATANAYNAGQQYVQQGRENMQYNPAFGAIQRAGGTIMSAMSPISGAMSAISKPIGRYFGPAPEHAADVALTAAPFAGGRAARAGPLETRALELTERPAPEFIGPPEMQGPRQITPQTLIGPPEMQGPNQAFRVNARMKARPGDPEFIGPSEQIGPQLPRQGSPEFIGPSDFVGPRQPPRPGDPSFIGPAEQIGPRLQRPGDFIGPPEMQGPRQLPRPTDPEFIGPREQIGPQLPARPGDPNFIGPQRPFMAERMSEPTALGAMGVGALTLARSMGPVGSGSTYMDQNTPSDLEAYAGNARLPTSVLDRSDSDVYPHGAVHLAKQIAAPAPASAPMPMAGPSNADLRAYNPQTGPSSGGLASLFSQPLSTKQLNQQSIDNPDDSGAWMRAERQYASTHKDHPNFDLTKLDPDTGMKRGGTVSGKSEKMPDPVHKALEIIHHLLMRH